MERKIRKRTLVYGFTAVLLATILGGLCYDFGSHIPEILHLAPPSPAATSAFLTTFPSYEALKDFLVSSGNNQGYYPYYYYEGSRGVLMLPTLKQLDVDTNAYSSAYSSTNIQVAGVDEADIVKTDGKYVYVLSGNVLVILDAYPAETARIVSRITLSDSSPIGIFVNGDRLVVLGHENLYIAKYYYGYYSADANTFVNIYDIHDRANPVLLRKLTVTGSYFNSRMIGEYVYFVSSQPAYVTLNNTINLPRFDSGGQTREVNSTEIYYRNDSETFHQFTTFVAMNMQNASEAPTYLTVMLGGTSNMYVSPNNLYLTFPDTDGNTTLYRVHVVANNMTYEATGKVPGHELNQFSMDEYDNHFRIATTTWVDGTTQNNLYTLDMNLGIVGRLENLASGENLHSARFMGIRCYFVTFEKVDPLFVIDLSEPTNPAVLGQLKIPGYSDYLHPYDETHLIGVGKETVEAEGGLFAWYQGIKVSLFDVSNVTDPKQMANYIIGDRGSDSPILTDHKAFLFDKGKNLLVIPVMVAEIDENQYPQGVPANAYGTPTWQGAYVFNVSLAQGLVFKGGVTHLGNSAYVGNNAYWVKRSLYINDVLYTVSDNRIKMNSLTDLSPLNYVELP